MRRIDNLKSSKTYTVVLEYEFPSIIVYESVEGLQITEARGIVIGDSFVQYIYTCTILDFV